MKKKVSASSFQPELFKLLVEGSKRRVELPMPSYKKAIMYRSRLYALRNIIIAENNPQTRVVALASITVTWDKNAPVHRNTKNVAYPQNTDIPATLVVQPRDSKLSEIIRRVGIQIDTPTINILDSIPTPESEPKPHNEDIQRILDKYKPEEEPPRGGSKPEDEKKS